MTDGRDQSRVQRRMNETREKILKAALRLFADKGFGDTTVADITAAADIGKGTFFTYFATKEAVAQHVGEVLLARMVERLDELATHEASQRLTALERLRALFAAMIEWHEDNPELSRLFMDAALRSVDVVNADAPTRDRLFQTILELVREGQARGEITKRTKAPAIAATLGGTYFGVFLQWYQRGKRDKIGALLRPALDVVFRGLEP